MSWNGIPFTHCIILNYTAAGGRCHPLCSMTLLFSKCFMIKNNPFAQTSFSKTAIFLNNVQDEFWFRVKHLSRTTDLY